jgi:ribosomal protein L40E
MEKQSDKLLEECPKCHSKNIKNVKSSRNNYHEYNSPPDPTLFDELVCMDCGHA